MSPKRHYHILSWNVNGIRAAHRKGFLDWLKKTKPDLLCIQETKIQETQIVKELLEPEGYKTYWAFAERKGYSGVATYTRHSPKNIQIGLGIKRFDDEGRVVVTEFDDFISLNIYFPNGQKNEERLQYKLDFYEAVFEYCQKLRKRGQRVLISGDVNTAHKPIDLAHPDANAKVSGFLPIERKWIDELLTAGYIDTFRFFHSQPERYTWWSPITRARERNVGWRIDYHLVSEELKPHLKNASIMDDVHGSDHCPVGVQLTF